MAGEIFSVAGVDRGALRVRGGGDKQIHHPRHRWLAPNGRNTDGKPAVALRYTFE